MLPITLLHGLTRRQLFLGCLAGVYVALVAATLFLSVQSMVRDGRLDLAIWLGWLQVLLAGLGLWAAFYALMQTRWSLQVQQKQIELINHPSKIEVEVKPTWVEMSGDRVRSRTFLLTGIVTPGVGPIESFRGEIIIHHISTVRVELDSVGADIKVTRKRPYLNGDGFEFIYNGAALYSNAKLSFGTIHVESGSGVNIAAVVRGPGWKSVVDVTFDHCGNRVYPTFDVE